MSKPKTENVAPYMTAKQEIEVSENLAEKKVKKCSPFGRCYIVGVSLVLLSFAVVLVASFFQDEYRSVVASVTSNFADEAVVVEASAIEQDVAVAAIETAIETEVSVTDEVQATAQPVQVNAVRPVAAYPYQPYNMYAVQNRGVEEKLRKQHEFQNELMQMQQARIAELEALRTKTFYNVDQDPNERYRAVEEIRSNIRDLDLEIQKKMQQAYNDFHSI